MNRLLCAALLLIAMSILSPAADAAIIVDALYKMGEADPAATAGHSTNATAVDSATSSLGGGGNLTLVNHNVGNNTATYSANTSAPGSSLATQFSFNSDGSAGSYYSNLSAIPYAHNYGVEAYVNVSAINNNRGGLNLSTLVYDGNSGGQPGPSGMGLLIQNSGGNEYFSGIESTIGLSPVSPTPLALHTWYQVALVDTQNSTGPDTQTLYINGVAVASQTVGNTGTNYSPSNLSGVYIGSDNADDGFSGLLDNVALFHFAQGGFNPADLAGIGVPEPSTFVLAGVGLAALFVARGRQRRR